MTRSLPRGPFFSSYSAVPIPYGPVGVAYVNMGKSVGSAAATMTRIAAGTATARRIQGRSRLGSSSRSPPHERQPGQAGRRSHRSVPCEPGALDRQMNGALSRPRRSLHTPTPALGAWAPDEEPDDPARRRTIQSNPSNVLMPSPTAAADRPQPAQCSWMLRSRSGFWWERFRMLDGCLASTSRSSPPDIPTSTPRSAPWSCRAATAPGFPADRRALQPAARSVRRAGSSRPTTPMP